jgi:uncharacterized protein YcbK (DUF882 family)
MVLLVGGHAEARRRRKRRASRLFVGHAVPVGQLRAEPPPKPSGEIYLWAVNHREEMRVNIYGPNGELDRRVLASLDQLMRCRRTGDVKPIDPRVYEQLSRLYDHFHKRIHVISGYRNQARKTSKHYTGYAVDFVIEGVPNEQVRAFVASLDSGGTGLGTYPHVGHVHVDVRPNEPSYYWVDSSPKGGGEGGGPFRALASRRR